MPGAQERILRRRIGSVQNTKKITRAMELIAATRVVKAQEAANDARPYSEQITSVISNLAAGGAEVSHPLLRQATDVRKVGFIVLTSDRGLAGAYNSTVIRAAEKGLLAAIAEGKEYSLVVVGRKAEGYFKFRGFSIDAAFSGMSDKRWWSAAFSRSRPNGPKRSRPAPRLRSNSSRPRPRCSSRCCRGTSRVVCSPRCSMPPLPNTPTVSGP